MNKVAIVIHVYKENLNELEKISLMQVKKILGKYPIIFVAPEGKKFSYLSADDKAIYFPQHFFKSKDTYNILMKSKEFYQSFLDYDYILIHQPDAFVFSDKLEYFCNLGYDNIGASWPLNGKPINLNGEKFRPRVGNGGFCLRNVKACVELLKNYPDLNEKLKGLPEDVFWSVAGMIKDSGFRTAPINVAYKFSAEYNPVRCVKKNGGELPFGCHAWHNFCAYFYIKVFANYGYDLRPFQNQMRNTSANNQLISDLHQRLLRRINKRQSLIYYLPKTKFSSIRVVRTPYTMIILARLFLENIFLSDKIYFYNEDETDILINDLNPEKLPHLLITPGWNLDNPLIEALAKKGLTYGKRFINFHREYFLYCEKIFHNLGK